MAKLYDLVELPIFKCNCYYVHRCRCICSCFAYKFPQNLALFTITTITCIVDCALFEIVCTFYWISIQTNFSKFGLEMYNDINMDFTSPTSQETDVILLIS